VRGSCGHRRRTNRVGRRHSRGAHAVAHRGKRSAHRIDTPSPPTFLRLIGDGKFTSENLLGYEAGYRTLVNPKLYIDIGGFITTTTIFSASSRARLSRRARRHRAHGSAAFLPQRTFRQHDRNRNRAGLDANTVVATKRLVLPRAHRLAQSDDQHGQRDRRFRGRFQPAPPASDSVFGESAKETGI